MPIFKYRAEGQTLGRSLLYAIPYLLKYRFKFRRANSFQKSHFTKTILTVREKIERQKSLHSPFRGESENTNPGLNQKSSTLLQFSGDLMWIQKNWESFLSLRLLERLREASTFFGNLEIGRAHV